MNPETLPFDPKQKMDPDGGTEQEPPAECPLAAAGIDRRGTGSWKPASPAQIRFIECLARRKKTTVWRLLGCPETSSRTDTPVLPGSLSRRQASLLIRTILAGPPSF